MPDKNPLNIDEFRTSGHKLVDQLADYLKNVDQEPVYPDAEPSFLEELFDEIVPSDGKSMEEVMKEINEKLLPYCTQVNHPGYFGLITPSPTPVGILGDFIASALNQNIGAYTIGPAAVTMERRTIRWLNDLIGYDEKAGGNLTSGGMMANFIGLKLARDWASKDKVQYEGLTERWAMYVSEERHISLDKSADAVGIGRNFLRILPTDNNFSLNIDALENALAEDKRKGIKPAAIIALAGTTNTGSVDDLVLLRSIADREEAWLHADAAYGGGMLLSHQFPNVLQGLELADSVTMDPHKWFYAPLDAGAILVKDATRLTASFGLKPAYLTNMLDMKGERYNFYVHGFEQSKRFRSLKVWMSFKRYGTKQIGYWIDRNIDQALYLDELFRKDADFEVAVKPLMSAVCVRFIAGNLSQENRSVLHGKVVRRVEESGKFWIATTIMKGVTWFRINPVNLRTENHHMKELYTFLKKECNKSLMQQAL
jgi:glutamate/tyrosine decarboxylase-like PLP-dependent enzyme